MSSLLAICAFIYFLTAAIFNVMDHERFISQNGRMLEGALRKKFRRAEALYLFLISIWSFVCYVMMETGIRLDIQSGTDGFDFAFRGTAIGGGIILFLLALFVERIYFELIQ